MIAHPLYLPDYTLGHMMSHQIRSYMRGKDLAAETKRITSLGCLTPDLWMNRAVASSWGQKVVGSIPASQIFWNGLKPRSDAGFRFLMDEDVPKPRTPARPPLGLVAIDARGRPRLTTRGEHEVARCEHEVARCASFHPKDPSVVIDVEANFGDNAAPSERPFTPSNPQVNHERHCALDSDRNRISGSISVHLG